MTSLVQTYYKGSKGKSKSKGLHLADKTNVKLQNTAVDFTNHEFLSSISASSTDLKEFKLHTVHSVIWSR